MLNFFSFPRSIVWRPVGERGGSGRHVYIEDFPGDESDMICLQHAHAFFSSCYFFCMGHRGCLLSIAFPALSAPLDIITITIIRFSSLVLDCESRFSISTKASTPLRSSRLGWVLLSWAGLGRIGHRGAE
ncbi:hypothetical protein VTG60DRAFT_2397 [Thermothelomyces hinnuleus]